MAALVGWALALAACHPGAAAISPEQLEFFERKIRPVLAAECYECHGAEKQKGGLRVDFREALLKGGETGPAIVPSDPKKSLLVQAITHENPDIKMPKKRPKLDDKVIDDFIAWVKMGAPDPRTEAAIAQTNAAPSWEETLARRKQWWSFQPVKRPEVPWLKTAPEREQHPVDAFILAKLKERGLQAAAPAEKYILIRRLTFALTGLPPTPEEIERFVTDRSSDAYDKLVDRLLSSPQFGERWARHWMDLVRFAETHGSEGDPDIPQAWRYRDYLIRAFNGDVPCDQLIREQIAGDLLPNPRWNRAEGLNESIIGIAQLRLVEHGFQPVDALDDQVRVIENQIDVLGKAFQGLTIACARCHDHKFDAISQHDFYALYGIFASCRPTQVTIDAPERLRIHRNELLSVKEKIKLEIANAWTTAQVFSPLLAQLKKGNQPPEAEEEMLERINTISQRLAAAERNPIRRAFRSRLTNEVVRLPIAAWTFEGDARDLLGEMHGELLGGAEIKDGRLILNGSGAFVRTAPLTGVIREKTLEVWVALANHEQQGGGAITLESLDGAVFDSVVFAEREPATWMAGSDLFRRSQIAGLPRETAERGQLTHLAIVYGTNNSISIYRNGAAYGSAYTPSGDEHSRLQTYAAGGSRVLFGLRHTGAGNGFLAGAIEAACLYDQPLSGDEIAVSFRAGPPKTSAEEMAKAVTPAQQQLQENLSRELERLRARFKIRFPHYAEAQAAGRRWSAAVAGAGDIGNPLYPWAKLREKNGAEFVQGWETFVKQVEDRLAAEKRFTTGNPQAGWDFTSGDEAKWFKSGINPPEYCPKPGEFSLQSEGERILSGILPAGVYSHLLSEKHNGVLTSPRFKVETDRITVRALGGKGARVRLIVENYPIGNEGIYPQAELKNDAPEWLQLNTAYRKGCNAYLEFATAEEVLSRSRSAPGAGGRSWFGVDRIVFANSNAPPKQAYMASALLIEGDAPKSAEDLVERYGRLLHRAATAWGAGTLNEPERAFLDFFVRNDLLPNSTNALPQVASLLASYRALESEIPVPRRAPGVMEAVGYNAPLLQRGDHTKPREPVPRRYLEAFASDPYATKLSGRLELANEIASASNPLTARVMVNRIWHHLFGRGLVPTVDNFGRLGEKPVNPELLDFLAAHFVEHGWSFKEMIRFLVTSRAYQMSSEASERARESDPMNEWLSHMPVRRLEAEVIRDSLLAVAGRLDPAMFGAGVNALASPPEQRRRSIYMTVRRTSLSPFLQVFDAPKPFTTLGRREPTNVPAQSLALLNDPFVIEMATRWAASLISAGHDADLRVREMFQRVFAREPTASELEASRVFLAELAREHDAVPSSLSNEKVWRDFAQSLFNLKELIYVR